MKMLILLSCVLLCGSSVFGLAIGEEWVLFRGDVDGSNSLNISDTVMLNNYLFNGGPTPPTCSLAWDANSDGYVNGSDSVFLLNYLFSAGSAPSSEFVLCE